MNEEKQRTSIIFCKNRSKQKFEPLSYNQRSFFRKQIIQNWLQSRILQSKDKKQIDISCYLMNMIQRFELLNQYIDINCYLMNMIPRFEWLNQ